MKKMKKKISVILIAVLVLTSFSGQGIEAKKKKIATKVSSIKITNVDKKLRLQKGKTFRLKSEVKVKPNKAKYKKVKYTSSNRKVALVNSQGLIKGKKVGTSKITVFSKENTKKKASITVNVTNDILVKSIKLDKKVITVDEFNEEDIEIKVTKILPSNAKNKDINWSTSDEKVADVDDDGVVTTGDVGTAIITATADDKGGATATCKVVVTKNEDQEEEETEEPKNTETSAPTLLPGTVQPPTAPPNDVVTQTPMVTTEPTVEPSTEPSTEPTPTTEPTTEPTAEPTTEPTAEPTPTTVPTTEPTAEPTPTTVPTTRPTAEPTGQPSTLPPIQTLPPIPTVTPITPTSTPIQSATPMPTEAPMSAIEYYFTDIYQPEGDVFGSDANVTAVKDEQGRACTEIHYTRNNQYIFFKLPKAIKLSDYKSITITANVPAQLVFRILNDELDADTDRWWSYYSEFVNYPFYGGSKEDDVRGIETVSYDLSDVEENGKISDNLVFVSNTMPVEGYGSENYLLYSVQLEPKEKTTPVISISSNPDTSEKPSEPVVPSEQPAPAFEAENIELDAKYETEWTIEGNYGSQVYNTLDKSVEFFTEPKTDGKAGEVYNNGIGWYLAESKLPVDISAYDTMEVTVSGEYWNVKMMTWSSGAFASSYWDKKDFWGDHWKTKPVQNQDGSYTMYYDISDVFVNPKKVSAVGLTLKSCDGEDDSTYVTKSLTIHSIRFSKEENDTPEEPEEPTPDTPSVDTPSVETAEPETPCISRLAMFTELCMTESGDICSHVALTDVLDDENYPCTEIHYTQNNQYVFLKLPEAVNLSDYSQLKIRANVPEQLVLRVYNEDLDTNQKDWWVTYSEFVEYPFYGGSKEDDMRGIETVTYDLTEFAESGNRSQYLALISNIMPASGYRSENYLLYSIELVPNVKKGNYEGLLITGDPSATEKPSAPSVIPDAPAFESQDIELDAKYETEWTQNGDYGSQVYNTLDKSVVFSTEPKTEGKTGEVYNNGIGWYLAESKLPVDISAYDTMEVTVSGEYWNVKMMTWSDGASGGSYWNKKDSWGDHWQKEPVRNEDGSYTMYYDVSDVFANPKRVSAIGLTVKACEDEDDSTYVAKSLTIHSIRLT